jgi:predicted metal-binding membrane protein
MESATLQRRPPLPAVLQAGLVALLFAIAAASWAVTDDRMGGMDAGPGTDLGEFGWFVGAWVTMMAAMMFPSISPMVLAYARRQRQSGTAALGAGAGPTAIFVAGYLVVWTTVGIAAYALIEGVRSLELGFLAWDRAGPYVAGAVILGAGAYQLTRLKDSCLRRCRDPHAFLTEHWRPGPAGALRMGIEHGSFCVGCCWALMAALLALGVMSIAWMVLIAALIAAEKLLPWGTVANRGIAVFLAVLGIALAVAPEDVPGLTIPGSPEAVRAMEAMGMEAEGGAMEMESEGMGSEGGAMEMKSEGMGSDGGAMEMKSEGMGSEGGAMEMKNRDGGMDGR